MPHFFERTALILLAGTALTACAGPSYPIRAPLVQVPMPAPPPASPQRMAAVERAPEVPTVTAPVESRELAALPAARPSVAAPSAPAPMMAVPPPAVDAAARTRASGASYTVRRGDTLAGIAAKNGTDIETLGRLNGLARPYRLQPGLVLKLRADAPRRAGGGSAAPREAGETYTVRRGDTLFGIAQKLGTTVSALQEANGLGRGATLMAGRKLRLPGSADAPEAEDEPPSRAATSRRERPAEREAVPPASSSGGGERKVTGRVVNVDVPGPAYRVKSGDNLDRIAGRLDSSVSELAKLNKLKSPYRLQPGQTIRGPGSTAKAYTVGRGDTLADIAQRFGTTVDKLRAANGLRRGASVAPGRKLRLPAGYRDRGPIVVREAEVQAPPPMRNPPPERIPERPPERTTPPEVTPSEALPTRPQPYTPPPRATQPPRTTTPPRTFTPGGGVSGAPVATPQVSDAQITQMGRGLFIWPVRGEVLAAFGAQGRGQRNDGVNIRASTGDPVRAAADGDVVYAGDQVPGFGNLVLIKHADGWVTAYGHLSRVGVRMQQKVTQGQEIGQAGSSGGVSEPQLHFEVRYAPNPQERARPIDPNLVLPR